MNESITRAAGARHGQEMKPETLEHTISGCGREPRQRNTLYDFLGASDEIVAAGPLRGYG